MSKQNQQNSMSLCIDSLIRANALLSLAEEVILNHDVLRGDVCIGLSVLIADVNRSVVETVANIEANLS